MENSSRKFCKKKKFEVKKRSIKLKGFWVFVLAIMYKICHPCLAVFVDASVVALEKSEFKIQFFSNLQLFLFLVYGKDGEIKK